MPTMPLWPWWLGALAFFAVAILHLVVLRRPLGVSGLLRTGLSTEKRREEQDLDDVDDDDLQRALEEATRRAFGNVLPVVGDHAAATPTNTTTNAMTNTTTKPPPALPWSRSVLFLVGLVGGGLLAALLQGPVVEVMPGGLHAAVFGPFAVVALVGGGVLVGFGTAMSGGCTSGHGLVGVARLQVPSLVATACFFGIAIVVSVTMKALGLLGGP
jgi:uncharacterized membrane protein YedE/YeeE